MIYDFDLLVDRSNTNSVKWNYVKEKFGVDDILPMWVADMDFETIPEIRDAIISRAQHAIYGYTARSDSYYESIIDWHRRRHGWEIKKEWISHSSGVVNAIYNCINAFTHPGDNILIQSPVYHPFYHSITKTGRNIVLNPLKINEDRYVPDIDDLEKKLIHNKISLLILCNPHNPVGRVFTRDELKSIGELAIKYNTPVISDEIHSDLIFKGFKHIPFASISKEFEQNTIVCTAPSKTFNLAGLATSNIIIPNENLKKKYDLTIENNGIKTFNIFGTIACEAAYRHGEQWLDQLIDYIEENRDYALDFIKNKISKLKGYNPEGTYFLWIDCRSLGLDKTELENFMIRKAKLWFNQGYIFGSEGEGFIRINIACQRSTIQKALLRLEEAINQI